VSAAPPDPGVPSGLVVFTRARCGVCHRAEGLVRREVRRTVPWRRPTVSVVDVDAAGLADRYGVRVPVVVLDGVEIGELELAPGVVRAALRARGRSARDGRTRARRAGGRRER